MKAVTILFPALAAALSCSVATAQEIFRWVDADGVVHYSDERPREDVAVTALEIDYVPAPDYDPDADPWSIRNQAQRISESRAALVSLRVDSEIRRAAAESGGRPTAGGAHDHPNDRHDYRTDWRDRSSAGYGPSWWYYSAPGYVRPADPQAARRQQNAMEQLDLAGPRPQSINSGVHRQRVDRSTALPTTPVERYR